MSTTIKRYANTSWEAITSGFRYFLDNPVSFGLRFLAIILILEVVLTGVGELLKIDVLRYTYDIVESLMYLLLAWVLLSGAISRIAVGIFLLLVFASSIFFLIVPMDAAAELLKKTVDPGVNADISTSSDMFTYYLFSMLQYFSGKGAVFIYALLMGALGSSIVITRQYIGDFESRDSVWYIYRMLQGMIMALLIIYGLAAGMLSLGASEPFVGKNFEEIKYFVGFVSALAGLFSEQAFIKLQEVSKTLFGVKSEQAKDPG
jgi:hypothetical protein